MAEADDDPTTSSEERPRLAEASHLLGRHRPTHHNLPRELRQTTARAVISDLVSFLRDPSIVAKKNRWVLKDSAERLEPALGSVVGVLNEDRQTDLLTIMLECFRIGKVNDPKLEAKFKQLEEARKRDLESDAEARALGLELFDRERAKDPRVLLPPRDILKIAKKVAPLVVEKMRSRGHSKYSVEPETVVQWVADREKARSKLDT